MPLSPRTPDLPALETLLAVASSGSQHAAASELGVSPQAVAQRITALQGLVGVQLLDRTRRGSVLTADGEVVAQWAARVVGAATELDLGLAALRADHSTRLRVAASLTVAEHLLPKWLVALRAGRSTGRGVPPESTLVAVNSGTVLELVRDGAADLGFVESPGDVGGLRSRVVAWDELALVVPPDHALARRRRPVRPDELAALPLVAREQGSGTREAYEVALRAALAGAGAGTARAARSSGSGGAPERAVAPGRARTSGTGGSLTPSHDAAGPAVAPPVMALASTAAVRSAVLAGAGPAVLSRLVVADDLATGRLVTVATDGIDLRRELRAVWRGGAAPTARAARDLLAVASRRR
ncbi:LysR family transcriptional regulator [Luteimicrobium subarcticum]|uniref:DNA-binding transcriptional LysR family regulator n=1 Tax=Luteimicrobium subarcticum TaxID=620910 RepID=A0A2M8WJ45_9MICO|nr:LysR family transcriptional regulator [Luteimicrobium subarcticum]PJI90949.1 DNA-binding transcriptional LysR family regulator [Luteimicrobium subarcticum]